MVYKHISFNTADEGIMAILIACLNEEGYEGFEETGSSLNAFISEEQYNESFIAELAGKHGIDYEINEVQQQNWNAQWESSFEPVVVDGFCTIRADFHPVSHHTPFEIIITPKMSFGTGHHATTQLMISMMKDIDIKDKRVLDFGTGTGVLAILAEKLNASSVTAIDNDEWSVENTRENIERNKATRTTIALGSLEIVQEQQFDLILANINRHILLHYMEQLYTLLASNGTVLMSGLLTEDKPIIVEAAERAGFKLVNDTALNNWIALLFKKSN